LIQWKVAGGYRPKVNLAHSPQPKANSQQPIANSHVKSPRLSACGQNRWSFVPLSFRKRYVLRGVLKRWGTKPARFCPLKSCCCFFVAHKTPTACAASTYGKRFCPSRRQKGQNIRSQKLRTSMGAKPVCRRRGSIDCRAKPLFHPRSLFNETAQESLAE
jgi:hypothetical protein